MKVSARPTVLAPIQLSKVNAKTIPTPIPLGTQAGGWDGKKVKA